MASTTSFNQVLQTGISFLRVSLIIMVFVGLIGGMGIGLLEEGEYIPGAFFIGISVVTLLAGIIGLIQKLVSDAFLEGFAVAKSAEGVADGTRMDVSQTLRSGFSVIGVFLITTVVTGALFQFGLSIMSEETPSSNTIGSLIFATGCAIWLAILLGMLARVIAEGVAFGASSTGVYFESVIVIDSADKPSNYDSFMDDWSDHYKRLVFSTSVLVFGMFLPWYSITFNWVTSPLTNSGLDYLLALGRYPEVMDWGIIDARWGESQIMLFDSILAATGGGETVFWLSNAIWSIMPFAMLFTFGYAWYGYSNDDEKAAEVAGKVHVSLFIMMLFLFTLNVGMGNMWNDHSEIEYIFSGRLGLCVSGLAGLGLIPGVTDRIFLKGGGAPTSKTPNSEDSLEDTGLQ